MNDPGEAPDLAWPFVGALFVCDELESTSDRAAQLIRPGHFELPLAVWAKRQTRGRGRGSHTWWSDAGSLTFTLALDPTAHGLAVESESRLALATAVAVIEALGELRLGGPSVGIRWPNDIEVDDRKLGGILPERIETDQGHRLLIGVGLNAMTDLTRAPADVRRMATSLEKCHDESVDVQGLPRLLRAILRQFEAALTRLAEDDPSLAARWDQLDRLHDRWVRVDLGSRIVAGWGRGIAPDGALLLDDGGDRLRLLGGQVLRP